MALSPTLVDREQGKFRDAGSTTLSKVAVQIEGSSVSLSTAGFSNLSPGFPAQVAVGVASTTLIPANVNRLYAHVANHTNKTIYIELGASAVVQQGIRLSPGAILTLSGSDLWLGDVNAVTSTGTATISVTEAVA